VTWFYYLVAAGFGLIFGSFFNVCIYRMPIEEPLGQRSHCTTCGSTIRWYDNVPLVSFALLRGRCRYCHAPISWRYPLVELTTALLFVLMYWWSVNVVPGVLDVPVGRVFVPEVFIGVLLVSVIIISVGADITHGIVPNGAVFPGLLLMFALVAGLSLYRGDPVRIAISVGTGLGGGLFFLVAGLVGARLFMRGDEAESEEPAEAAGEDSSNDLRGRWGPADKGSQEDEEHIQTAMGMGDVKLMLFIGMALGYFFWYLVFVQVLAAALVGIIAFLLFKVFAGFRRKDRIPFAPSLAAGALVSLIWGKALVDLYLKLLR
jgi:leader peptidase (prepilin peptidase)/N-methyltransferase